MLLGARALLTGYVIPLPSARFRGTSDSQKLWREIMSSICHPVRVQRVLSRVLISAAVIFFLVCGSLIAQVISGSIFGNVTDPSGAIVSNATVTVRAPEIGLTRTLRTNEQGDF